MGSFGNVVISRVPKEEALTGRSHCPHCGRILSALELVPVLSWIMLCAKCRGCHKRIAFQYPLIELLSALLFVTAAYLQPLSAVAALVLAIAFWAMLLIAVIDLQTQMIPDVLTLLLALCGVSYHWMMDDSSFAPALIGIGFFGIQWVVSRGRWVGSGDIFLAGALGLIVGTWPLMIVALMASYIIGAAVALILLATGWIKKSENISFGPFLILGAMIALVWGQKMLAFVLP